MTRSYIYFGLAVAAIFVMQAFYVSSLYKNFVAAEQEHINNCIYQAIDLELHHRSVYDAKTNPDVNYKQINIPINEMPQKMLDSLLAICPLPTKSQTNTEDNSKSFDVENFSYDIISLMDNGVIRNKYEIEGHREQDTRYEKGKPINIQMLDSLFAVRLARNYSYGVEITNGADSLLAKVGNVQNYNYTTKRIQIGFKDYQYIKTYANITVSAFIMQSIIILVLSLLVVSIPLLSLVYLTTTIRSKQLLLDNREKSINGIIHDLKSPLGSVSTMLSVFKLTETDPERLNAIKANTASIAHLIKKIESLLNATQGGNTHVIVNKTQTNSQELADRATLLTESLKLSYKATTNSTITINNNIDTNKELYIDTMHYDTIVNNLVDNALKYSDANVDINIELSTNANNNLVLQISDNGLGIDKKHLKHIFKQYYRAPHKRIKGYGIGLSYVQLLAQAQGGSVKVESQLGIGSKFEIVIQ